MERGVGEYDLPLFYLCVRCHRAEIPSGLPGARRKELPRAAGNVILFFIL
jgi:hypothetical protein